VGTGKRGQGGHSPLEIWDCEVIIRKPKGKEQKMRKQWTKCVCPIFGCLPIDFDP